MFIAAPLAIRPFCFTVALSVYCTKPVSKGLVGAYWSPWLPQTYNGMDVMGGSSVGPFASRVAKWQGTVMFSQRWGSLGLFSEENHQSD